MDIISYAMGKKAGGTPVSLQDKEITIATNGETTITADSGYTGLRKVDLTTNVQPDLESKSITISTNTTTTITPTSGKDGLSSVEITTNVPQPSGKITITQNGTDIDVSSYASADVSVPGIVPTGTIDITSNNTYDVSNYASASVNVPSQKYAPKWMIFGNASSSSSAYQGSDLNYEVSNLSLTNLNTLGNMFANCQHLTSLDLSSWDTSNITNIANAFYNCFELVSLNVKDFNTSNVSNLFRTFYYCSHLTSLDLNNWTLKNGAYVGKMFDGCSSLTHLDIRNFNFSNASAESYSDMFGTTASTGVPDNCEIIVADATQKQWLNTNFSRLTNVKTVAEYEAE